MQAIDDVKEILAEEAADIQTLSDGIGKLESQLTATEAIVTDLEAKAAADTDDADLAAIAGAARQNLTNIQAILAKLPAQTAADPGTTAAPATTSGS